jgi:hypothetical protein
MAEASAEGREVVETAAAALAAAAMVAERSTRADAECLRPSRPTCQERLRPASPGGS